MTRRPLSLLAAFACAALTQPHAAHAAPLTGASLSHKSSGSTVGTAHRLDQTGYVGTYFTLDSPRAVTISASASGASGDAVAPRLGISVADRLVAFDVEPGTQAYDATFDLPAGTYFVRTQFANGAPGAGRSLTVDSLDIQQATSISNVSLTNRAVNEANALAAADTYIEHFRQGGARLALAGVAPGTTVEVRMRRNEFNFGTYVTGFDANTWVGALAPGETDTNRARYQDFITRHFNMLVPSNMGKWQPTENTQGAPTMGNVDAIIAFAKQNNMAFRQHNLAWGVQQPAWVNTLITNALAGDAQAKASLRQAVIDRIRYYVGDGDGNQQDGDRALSYEELDVVNEILRERTYYDIFGIDGLAEIHKLAKDAVEAAGADTLLLTNEYNVFNFANNPLTGASDNYANWYRAHVEQLNSAGYGQVVTGVGVQAQTNPASDTAPTAGQNHNTARMNQVLQNLSVLGLPITLTEFSVPAEAFGETTSPERAAELYTETLRMMYGAPLARSMLIWEPWPTLAVDQTSIVDANWNLTTVGQAFVALMDEWTTPTQHLTVGADGAVDLEGYYGQYEARVGGRTYVFDHAKDTPLQAVITQQFLAGDFNRDGQVDAADYTVWRDSLDLTGLTPYSAGDADGNGAVNGADYALWAMNYGQQVTGGVRAPVPEPSGVALVALAAAVARLARRRNHAPVG